MGFILLIFSLGGSIAFEKFVTCLDTHSSKRTQNKKIKNSFFSVDNNVNKHINFQSFTYLYIEKANNITHVLLV